MAAELSFSEFVLRPEERLLRRGDTQIPLGARAMDVLLTLVAHPGELVTKNHLMDTVWPGVVVEDNNLQVHVSTLRKLMGSDAIATVAGRGYRFTAEVRFNQEGSEAANEPSSQSAALEASVAAVPPTAQRAVAVLPFANLSKDPHQAYFSDGLAEDIISKLTRSPWLYVIARNSSFRYHGESAQTPAQICAALGARYVVTGSVRRAGDRLRVTAELVDGTHAETLWSKHYDRPLHDLFSVQGEISDAIVSAIEPVYLRREERRHGQLERPNMKHWDLLMRARWHFWRTSRDQLDEAQRCLTQALLLKPDDAPSLSLMAFVYMSRLWAGWTTNPKADIVEANRLALRAVRAADTDANAHFTLGTALSCAGNVPQAIAELEYALALYPQYAAAAGELGRLLAFSGRTDEAHEYTLQAMDVSPHDPHVSLWVRSRAIAAFVDQDYPQALRFVQQAVAKRPDWFFNYFLLAACYAACGDLPAARQALEQGEALGRSTMVAVRIGHPFVDDEMLQRLLGFLRQAGWTGAEPVVPPLLKKIAL